MPVIALILSTLFFWVIYWLFRMGGLERIQEARAQRRDAERRRKALESQRTAPLQAVDDPREAALVLMLLIARNANAPTREQYAAVEETARRVFGFERDLAERMALARFAAGRAESFEQAVGFFANLLQSRLTDAERLQLVEMLETIAAHDGPSELQRDAIETLTRRLWPIETAPFSPVA